MSTINFFEHCYKAVKDEYYNVLSKPTLSRKYKNSYNRVLKNLETAKMYDEITSQEYEDLKKRFKELDYEAYKERMKKSGM